MDSDKCNVWRNPEDEVLIERVSGVKIIWSEITPELKRHINESILTRLRYLDYFGRQKLMLLMTGLSMEQRDIRPENKDFEESLYGLVSIIDQREKEITDEDFDQKITDAVFGLSREEQRKLLKALEQKGEKQSNKTAEDENK